MRGGVCKKKLIEATQLWLGGHDSNQETLEDDLKKWGLNAEQMTPFLQLESEPEFKLFPEHFKAWQAFLVISTQFVVHSNGISGLNYQAVEAGLKMAGVEVNPELFAKIRVVECEVINWSNNG